ncbi:hypothetical protein A2U01_0069584, partial [Trifolium medium]|nr:hypothetical protein [Trifolium medium]
KTKTPKLDPVELVAEVVIDDDVAFIDGNAETSGDCMDGAIVIVGRRKMRRLV